jgi:hypothetical protein
MIWRHAEPPSEKIRQPHLKGHSRKPSFDGMDWSRVRTVRVIEGGLPTEHLLAQIVVAKCADGQPCEGMTQRVLSRAAE